MAGWQSDAIPLGQSAAATPAAASAAPAPQGWQQQAIPLTPSQAQPYSGSILPFSKDAQGNVSFDPNAGLLGSLIRSFTLPHDVASGQVDPNSPQGIQRAAEMGMMFSPASAAAQAGERALPGALRAVRPAKAPVPTAADLIDAGSAGYKAVRGAGVDYSPQAVANWAQGVRSDLEGDFHPSLAPASYKVLSSLETPPAASLNPRMPLAGLIAARQNLSAIAQNFNPAAAQDQAVASRIIGRIDQFINSPPPQSVVAGPAAAAAQLYSDANANYGAGMRSDKLNGIAEGAAVRAAAQNSGLNIGNTLRGKAAQIVDPQYPARQSGYSPAEIGLIQQAAEGTPGRNAVRYVGNVLGGGGGLGALAAGAAAGGAGASLGSPVLGAIAGMSGPAIGFGAKLLDNALTKRAFNKADEAVRMRSPLYQQNIANAPMSVVSPQQRALLLRMLLLQQQNQASLANAPRIANPIAPQP